MIYRRLVRPLLFRLDPEAAHELALGVLARLGPLAAKWDRPEDPRLAQDLFGRRFPNPIGLAAGADKFARAVPAWRALGFGFCELGTVTTQPQRGNPRPRVFRLPADEALLNRLGFNNDGAERTAARLAGWERRGHLHAIPVGINIGRSRTAPADAAAADYLASYERLAPFADYVVVNVSSPNTPGLRALQEREPLARILRPLVASASGPPVLVKIAPDLELSQLDELTEMVADLGVSGLVVGNTTLARTGLVSPHVLTGEEGGLSGRPLRKRSTALIRRIASRSRLPIVGVGGVFSADDAWEKMLAGATLVQVYTGLVYEGPGLVRRIARGLVARMEREGVRTIGEIVGQGQLAAAARGSRIEGR